MKRIANIVMMCMIALQAAAIVHTYAPASVLNSGNWVKVRVSETGIQCIPFDSLKKWGLNPEQVRVYGYGGNMLTQDFQLRKIDDLPSVGFYMQKGENGYILFYGKHHTGWQYSEKERRFIHQRNTYANYGYYFLSDNAGEQRLLSTPRVANVGGDTTLTSYTHYDIHELDSINLLDPQGGANGGGREWFGEDLSNTRRDFVFSIPNLIAADSIRYTVDVAAYSTSTSTFNLKSCNQSSTIITSPVDISDNYTAATEQKGELRVLPDNNTTQKLRISFDPSANGAKGYLNYIELQATAKLQMSGNELPIRTTHGYKQNRTMVYSLSQCGANTQVWDITEADNISAVEVQENGSTLRFAGSNKETIHEYIAFTPSAANWHKPIRVGNVGNQNLHKLQNIDYVIIAPAAYIPAAERLAKEHEKRDKLTYAVVTDEQVYNEFSSGTPDATAYRWLMKMLYDRANGNTTKQPKSLLLLGDGSFDNRKLLITSGHVGRTLLLTYQAENSLNEVKAYATDDYFAFMKNTEGTNAPAARMAFGVGRLPVGTAEEANMVVDKIIRYMQNDEYGEWKQQLLFLSDDGDHGLHTRTAEAGAEKVRIKNPDFVVNKVYLDAYPQEVNAAGESYPLAKNRVTNLLRDGILYMNYSGHGSYNSITNEGLLNQNDIERMNNKHLGFWMLATCSFAHFDAGKRSAAEMAVLNPNGGAIGVFSADRTVYANENTIINRNLCDTLFGHKNVFSYEINIGEACRIAKNTTGSGSNKMAYVLLGDPALRLNYPTELQVKTETKLDTINALTVHEVEGYIENSDHQKAEWFNGKVNFTIYDKLQQITTRDNDEKNPELQEVLTYNDYPSTIFRGEADVRDGAFRYVFMTPKDIRYNYGKGRIVYYAYDDVEHAEAVGHYEDFYVGGSADALLVDTIGPKVNIYLNNPAFQDGDKTYETPRFFADIEDEHGINTVGSGIGHDLFLIIDDDPKLSYILNNNFHAENSSYQKGQVSYLLPELSDGKHTLKFRAWDLLNNSTTRTLTFEVVKGLGQSIFSVSTYPNPICENGIMNINVQHDQPDVRMTTTFNVYNMQGQLVYHSEQNDMSEWQMNLGNAGLYSGIYIYNVILTSATGNKVSQAGKFIVTK